MMRLTNKLMKFRTFSTSNVTISDNFTRFAQFILKKPNFFKDAINQTTEDPNLKMVAMELKDGIYWPSFQEGIKQRNETLKNIYFHRFNEFDEIRYNKTFQYLKGLQNENYIAWLGTPGIGKCK